MNQQIRRWLPKKPICTGAYEFTPVGVQEVKPILYVWLIGTALSVLLIFVEMIIQKVTVQNNKEKKIQINDEKWAEAIVKNKESQYFTVVKFAHNKNK